MAQPLGYTGNIVVRSISHKERLQLENQAPWRMKETGTAVGTVVEASNTPGKQTFGQDSVQHSASLKRELSERTGKKERQNSLRHVKNSTEVLRQRSGQSSAGNITPDGGSGSREGRQFTVANVGNNGMIYLRPVLRSPHQRSPQPPFVFPAVASTGDGTLGLAKKDPGTQAERDSFWLGSQLSRSATRPRRRSSTGHGMPWTDSTPRRPASHRRARSFSTVDDTMPPMPEPGAFKIVIDRPDGARSKTAEDPTATLPTLEVQIPHYRLGTPHFSSRGTAILRSSAYTRTSTTEDMRSSGFSKSEYHRLFPAPPGMDTLTKSKNGLHPSEQPLYVRIAPPNGIAKSSAALTSSDYQRLRHLITPSIFDVLASNPDDATIVRYSNGGDITAATPARIIAQITSKQTVDYELVSDFFLTYRSYLSSHELLAYLMARFHWAINGFHDDGRVIRVRVFAAIRHWILNYFVYDFVTDRELQIEFCDRVNSIAREVCGRPSQVASDLKLIADLKKCWNGRCVLYWDSPAFQGDGNAEIDIVPGGVWPSRDSQSSQVTQVNLGNVDRSPPQVGPMVVGDNKANVQSWFEDVNPPVRSRIPKEAQPLPGTETSALPTSPMSERSIHVTSCAVPARGFKRAIPMSGKAAGIHPVPTDSLAADGSWASHTKHGHKRSGSFSDALRDYRAPLPAAKADPRELEPQLAYFYAGALIRGNTFLPVQPYINALAPSTPISELPGGYQIKLGADRMLAESAKVHTGVNPGMKTFIGSIRRALSTKQSANHPVSASATSVESVSPAAKSSALPANVVQITQGRRGNDTNPYGPLRIDFLANEIMEAFKRVVEEQSYGNLLRQGSFGTAFGNERVQPLAEVAVLTAGVEALDIEHQPTQAMPGDDDVSIANRTALMSGALTREMAVATLDEQPMPGMTRDALAADAEVRLVRAAQANLPEVATSMACAALVGPHSGQPNNTVNLDSAQPDHLTPPQSVLKENVDSSMPGSGNLLDYTQANSSSVHQYNSMRSAQPRYLPQRSVESVTISSVSDGHPSEVLDKAPARMLRRKPGGNLRAAQTVHNLEQIPRPRSTGSINTYSDSLRSSVLYMASRPAPGDPIRAVSTTSMRKPLSLMRSRSSQAPLRPSFEAAMIEFSNIPDDADGGIESALLKLEGRYGPGHTSENLPEKTPAQQPQLPEDNHPSLNNESGGASMPLAMAGEDNHCLVSQISSPRKSADGLAGPAEGASERSTLRGPSPALGQATSPAAKSEDSYNSTPLLERGLSHKSIKRIKPNCEWSETSIPRPLFSRTQSTVDAGPMPSDQSFAYMPEPDNVRRMGQRSTYTQRSRTTDSFLLDEDEDLSDLSSEISMEVVDHQETMDRYFKPAMPFTQGFSVSETGMLSHPLRHPPSPPTTMENALSAKPQQSQLAFQYRLPTPDPSPTTRCRQQNAENLQTLSTHPFSGHNAVPETMSKLPQCSGHIPFILAYDSEAVAQQFTIIEEDALSEIDWKDLVDMTWHQTPPACLNWVDYLRTVNPKGIDIVTARFNVMVKWALSEIVLTSSLHERARTVVKYIHIAQHARKVHNYATMFQLTIALTSIDCTRLTQTWSLVPVTEKQILKELEGLVQPMRNFHKLRMEMETVNGEEGCIPVLALYIHDLTYNAQKPARITVTQDGEPLVNFERYRTAASIVKSLLRLIDASTKYTFQPIEGLIERCLWMAALPDERIRRLSRELE